jgi:poly-beta-1,6-N-acetyl-D-glucosamine synthase
MLSLPAIFWMSTLVVVYTFVIYPVLIAFAARFWPRPIVGVSPVRSGFSIIMSVRNEQASMNRRLHELIGILEASAVPAELLVICDGSTDDTIEIARSTTRANVRIVEWAVNRGKAAALNHAASLAQYEVLILADVRQTWAEHAVQYLLECFEDSRVGAVSGQLVLTTTEGKLGGVGLYWRFEKWLRSKEAQLHSQIGVTGAICAVRRDLFCPLPPGIILDDVHWPMQVVMQGRRVVYQPKAIAFDELPTRGSDELRRKVRTLVGNFQLLSVCPQLLMPWRNPLIWQFASHKLMRLVAPWALLAMVFSAGLIAVGIYRWAFMFFMTSLAVGIVGMITPLGQRYRLFSTTGSFLLLQFAAWLAFWYWIFGRTDSVWSAIPSQSATADQVQL